MRNFHLLLPLLFCVVFSVGSLRADDSFTLKSYPVDPEIFAPTIAPAGGGPFGGADPFGGDDPFGDGEVPPEPGIAETEHIFKLAKLPEGSVLRYIPHRGRFFARTSAAGHERLKEVLDEMKVPKLMVEIDFSFIGVNSNEVLSRKKAVQTPTESVNYPRGLDYCSVSSGVAFFCSNNHFTKSGFVHAGFHALWPTPSNTV